MTRKPPGTVGIKQMSRQDYNAHMAAQRWAKQDAFFKDKVCEDCGATKFLRLRSTDGSNLDTIWDWHRDRREPALAACRVLCKSCWYEDCWRVRETRDRSIRPHGLLRAYQTRCTCWQCTSEKFAWKHYWRMLRWQFRVEPWARMPHGVIDPNHVKEVLELLASANAPEGGS